MGDRAVKDELGHTVHKKSYKQCRDCDATMGDTDLYLKGAYVYCSDDYMRRFGMWPGLTQTPEQVSPEE